MFKSISSDSIKTSNNAPNRLLVISLLMVLVLIGMLFFPDHFGQIDTYLKPFANILQFCSLLFALIALFVAILSYKSSVLRPHLTLQVTPLQQVEDQVKLHVDSNNRVTLGRPLNEWAITLRNDGEASAKFPMVRMVFELPNHAMPYFKENDFSGWKAILHVYSMGYYGFQWSPDSSVIIYPGFSISLPSLSFSNKRFQSDFSVTFTFVADGVRSNTLRIPVKIVHANEVENQNTNQDEYPTPTGGK